MKDEGRIEGLFASRIVEKSAISLGMSLAIGLLFLADSQAQTNDMKGGQDLPGAADRCEALKTKSEENFKETRPMATVECTCLNPNDPEVMVVCTGEELDKWDGMAGRSFKKFRYGQDGSEIGSVTSADRVIPEIEGGIKRAYWELFHKATAIDRIGNEKSAVEGGVRMINWVTATHEYGEWSKSTNFSDGRCHIIKEKSFNVNTECRPDIIREDVTALDHKDDCRLRVIWFELKDSENIFPAIRDTKPSECPEWTRIKQEIEVTCWTEDGNHANAPLPDGQRAPPNVCHISLKDDDHPGDGVTVDFEIGAGGSIAVRKGEQKVLDGLKIVLNGNQGINLPDTSPNSYLLIRPQLETMVAIPWESSCQIRRQPPAKDLFLGYSIPAGFIDVFKSILAGKQVTMCVGYLCDSANHP